MSIDNVAPVIDDNGISAPTLEEIVTYLQDQYRRIFGDDIYLDSDSQDGQLIAIIASAINDTNTAAIQCYRAFSPSTASGEDLSSVVKINNIQRQAANNSSADVHITGVAGTVISNGVVRDSAGLRWNLPATVTIGTNGSVTATAVCQTSGAITAAAGAINQILTPVRGWQTVNNPAQATVGKDVELDGSLRQRQSASTALPAQSILDSVVGAVANIDGVQRYKGYENNTGAQDDRGIDARSIALVVEGGDSDAIAEAIFKNRSLGVSTQGDVTINVTDQQSIQHATSFYRPTGRPVTVDLDLTAYNGYLSTYGDSIKSAIADYVSTMPIGANIYRTRLYVPANLSNDTASQTFEVTALRIGVDGGAASEQDVTLAFNETAAMSADDVTINVST